MADLWIEANEDWKDVSDPLELEDDVETDALDDEESDEPDDSPAEDDELEEAFDYYEENADVVSESLTEKFHELLEVLQEKEEAIQAARVALGEAVERYAELHEYVRSWMDEHMEQGDIPVWEGEWDLVG